MERSGTNSDGNFVRSPNVCLDVAKTHNSSMLNLFNEWSILRLIWVDPAVSPQHNCTVWDGRLVFVSFRILRASWPASLTHWKWILIQQLLRKTTKKKIAIICCKGDPTTASDKVLCSTTFIHIFSFTCYNINTFIRRYFSDTMGWLAAILLY